MTVDELVKNVLNGRDVELFDRSRIRTLLRNIEIGFGKAFFTTTELVIIFGSHKNSNIKYRVPVSLLTKEQISLVQKRASK
jgi:hypothetical protein